MQWQGWRLVCMFSPWVGMAVKLTPLAEISSGIPFSAKHIWRCLFGAKREGDTFDQLAPPLSSTTT